MMIDTQSTGSASPTSLALHHSGEEMDMQTINISMHILSGNLFRDGGYDEESSASNYAELVEQAFISQAERDWPGAAITVDIDVQRASGCGRALEIEGTDDDGGPVLCDNDVPSYERTAELIFEERFDDWAVEQA